MPYSTYETASDPDLTRIPEPEPEEDHFDCLPDSIILLIFNKIADVKSLGRCSAVSRRFRSLVPLVDSVLIRVDCVISDDDSVAKSPPTGGCGGSSSLSCLVRLVFGPILKPFQALGQFLGSKRPFTEEEEQSGGVTHHSPAQVLRNFKEIRFLRMELPRGELGIEEGVLLKWRADFGSTLDKCLILGASHTENEQVNPNNNNSNDNNNNNDIPESFYTEGGLKLRVVWTISSLIAASARHYLLQPIITKHKTLENLLLTDADGQGVLCMNREELEELRAKPLSAASSSTSKRTLVPALDMRLWYAPELNLPDGTLLKGATLVAIRPSESKREACDSSWVASAFGEPYGTAVRMLIKGRTYCLEMNSF